MLPQAVSDHYQAQQRLIVGTLGLTRREWDAMSLADLDGSWAKVAPRVNLLTASAQLGSARNGAGYVAATLDEFGEDLAPAGLVNPRAFAGVASDGRPLDTLLDGALYRAKATNSLEAGGKWLDMAVHTQIADAGRSSASVAIASYDDVGWVRMVNPPCCGPCAVLAGKKYRYNQGFERHPRCDCVHIPSTLANPADNMGVNPSLDQITDLTAAEREALAEGADLPQVINARRRRSRDKMSTLEGTSRRGQRRLTPDGIFAQAKDRDEALALLRQHGYLSEYGRAVRVTPWSTPTTASWPATRPRLAPREGPIVGAMETPPRVGSWVPHSDRLFARTQANFDVTREAIAKQEAIIGKKAGDARAAYCLDGYGQMNAYMRTGEVSRDLGRYSKSQVEQFAEDMVKAFDRSESTTTYNVFRRGVRASDDGLFNPGTYYTEGAVLQEAGFTSTTVSGEAKVFARGDGWVMDIMVPPGHPTVLGTYYEREVILPPGITQRVVKVDKEARRIWIEVDPPIVG